MFNSIYDNLFSFYLDDFRVWPFIWRTVKMLQKKMPQFLYFFCACEIYLIRNSIMNVSLQISWRRKGMEFENYHGIHLNFSHSSIFISYSVIQVFCPNAKRQSESDCPNNCHLMKMIRGWAEIFLLVVACPFLLKGRIFELGSLSTLKIMWPLRKTRDDTNKVFRLSSRNKVLNTRSSKQNRCENVIISEKKYSKEPI